MVLRCRKRFYPAVDLARGGEEEPRRVGSDEGVEHIVKALEVHLERLAPVARDQGAHRHDWIVGFQDGGEVFGRLCDEQVPLGRLLPATPL